jgi:dienelactone hydrolase
MRIKFTTTGLFFMGVFILMSVQLCGQSVTILDTVYTPDGYGDGPLTGTVYIPTVSNGIGVVLAHYYTGTRQTLNSWCDTLAAYGYVAMTIDYYDWSNASCGIYPKPVRAFKIAVEFLRRNAARFGISTGKIVGFGKSEGAFHWGETIIWDNDDAYFDTDPLIDDHLDAAILLYGLYDNNRFIESTLPLNQLLTNYFSPDSSLRSTKGDCIVNFSNITTPVLLIHGNLDQIIQIQQSVQLNDSLIAIGKTSELISGPWDHGFDNTDTPPYSFTAAGLIIKDSVLAFLNRTLEVTSVSSSAENQFPDQFALSQNFPNPFNPTTTIKFSIPKEVQVNLSVYNILGEKVEELKNEIMKPGYFEVEFDASTIASGVYFYRIKAGDFVQTKKMILLK